MEKLIHYINFNNYASKSSLCKDSLENIQKMNPNYKLMEHNENTEFVKQLFNSNSTIKRLLNFYNQYYDYYKSVKLHEYIRLQILYEYGGFYIETDMFTLKPFEEFYDINKDYFISTNEDYVQNCSWYPIHAVKHSKHIKEIIDYIDNMDIEKFLLEKETLEWLQIKLQDKDYNIIKRPDIYNYISHLGGLGDIVLGKTSTEYLTFWTQPIKKIFVSFNTTTDNVHMEDSSMIICMDKDKINTDNYKVFSNEYYCLKYVEYIEEAIKKYNIKTKTTILYGGSVLNYIKQQQ